jgi:type 1 glutamine amidotransferase
MRHRILLAGMALLTFSVGISSDARVGVAADKPSPIKALLITGGCCHDYDGQKKILSEGISARANVVWKIVQQGGTGTTAKIPLHEDPDWAKGFDVVVHNECFADVKEVEWLERVLKPHKEGTPAVVIHCAMHCYRAPTDEWFKFTGVTTRRHGSHFAYTAKNVKADHPILKGFPDAWETPKEELYNIETVHDTATPLVTGYSPETKKDEVCVWANTYHKTRVFGTTIGHYNETMKQEVYLGLVTRGLLWSVDKLGDDGKPKKGYEPAPKAPAPPEKEPTPAKPK